MASLPWVCFYLLLVFWHKCILMQVKPLPFISVIQLKSANPLCCFSSFPVFDCVMWLGKMDVLTLVWYPTAMPHGNSVVFEQFDFKSETFVNLHLHPYVNKFDLRVRQIEDARCKQARSVGSVIRQLTHCYFSKHLSLSPVAQMSSTFTAQKYRHFIRL